MDVKELVQQDFDTALLKLAEPTFLEKIQGGLQNAGTSVSDGIKKLMPSGGPELTPEITLGALGALGAGGASYLDQLRRPKKRRNMAAPFTNAGLGLLAGGLAGMGVSHARNNGDAAGTGAAPVGGIQDQRSLAANLAAGPSDIARELQHSMSGRNNPLAATTLAAPIAAAGNLTEGLRQSGRLGRGLQNRSVRNAQQSIPNLTAAEAIMSGASEADKMLLGKETRGIPANSRYTTAERWLGHTVPKYIDRGLQAMGRQPRFSTQNFLPNSGTTLNSIRSAGGPMKPLGWLGNATLGAGIASDLIANLTGSGSGGIPRE
jgi:hypothetical protein